MSPDDPRAPLLAALIAEQHNGGGWRPTHNPRRDDAPAWMRDDDLTTARRRRDLADADTHKEHTA